MLGNSSRTSLQNTVPESLISVTDGHRHKQRTMINRRKFIQASGFTGLASLLGNKVLGADQSAGIKGKPIIISTWAPNVKANAAAWEILGTGGRALDAVVKGVQVPEADPSDNSVGYGGLPDRDGKVTLDS